MYRRLEGARIVETLHRLERQIKERFPGSGLSQVGEELLAVARESTARAAELRRPNRPLRIASGLLIALMVALGVGVLVSLRRWTLADLIQSQAIQNFVFLGVAVLFLATVETRLKRRRALKALHELRSIAHVVDMHQLSKVPDQFLPGANETEVAPDRRMTRADLARYLDYCTDLLSPTSKVAALYVENLQDPVVLEAVNDVENLTAGLSRKIWQKITILDTAVSRDPSA
jgi:hypothetical protein